jgi:hypothetical protein
LFHYAPGLPYKTVGGVFEPGGSPRPSRAIGVRALAFHPVSAGLCRDTTALALEKQQLNPVTARSKHYVAKNVISRVTRQ